MGVAAIGPQPLSEIAPRVPLVKFFKNHPWLLTPITPKFRPLPWIGRIISGHSRTNDALQFFQYRIRINGLKTKFADLI